MGEGKGRSNRGKGSVGRACGRKLGCAIITVAFLVVSVPMDFVCPSFLSCFSIVSWKQGDCGAVGMIPSGPLARLTM